jgi:hypothetical protein
MRSDITSKNIRFVIFKPSRFLRFMYNKIPGISPSQFYHILGTESWCAVTKYNEFFEHINDKQSPSDGTTCQNVQWNTPSTMSAEIKNNK